MSDEERGVEEVPVAEVAEEPPMGEQPTVEPPAEPVPATPPPMTPMVEPEESLAPRNHTGLLVVIASIVILLIAFAFAGPALYTLVIKRSVTSGSAVSDPAKAKITAAIGFVKASQIGDVMAMKGFLTDAAQNAITADQWKVLAAEETSAQFSFSSETWSGDTTAVVMLTAQDSTGTLTFSIDPAKALSVVMTVNITGGASEVDTIDLVSAGSGWRVVSISNGADTFLFDAALVKSWVVTDTAEPPTSTP